MKPLTATWKPISTKPTAHYSEFTLVRVKGWCRPAFAMWLSSGWSLCNDPYLMRKGDNHEITHWLALPARNFKSPQKDL